MIQTLADDSDEKKNLLERNVRTVTNAMKRRPSNEIMSLLDEK